MVAIVKERLTFEEFLAWDDGSGRSFELVNGVAMPLSEPTAKHEDVADGLCHLLVDHCQSLNLPDVPRQSKQVRLNSAPGENESSRTCRFGRSDHHPVDPKPDDRWIVRSIWAPTRGAPYGRLALEDNIDL
jgi:hypothetical protein